MRQKYFENGSLAWILIEKSITERLNKESLQNLC